MSRSSDTPQIGHLDLDRRVFGYLNKYPRRGYEINTKRLTIDANYEKVQIKYDFGNQYSYFSDDIDDQFTKPLLE